MTIDEVYKNGHLSVRSYNVCIYNNIKTDFDLIKYFSNHKTFKQLRNCGEKSNTELIQLSSKFQENTFNEGLIKNEYSIIQKIKTLSRLQRQVINSFIKINTSNLQVRSRNAIIALVSESLSLKDFSIKIFGKGNFQISLIKNVGKTSIPELENYLIDIKLFIQEVSENNNENNLICLKNKHFIQSTFSIEHIPNTILQSQSIVKLCNFLIQENTFFIEKYNSVFINTLNVFKSDNIPSLDDMATELNYTRERVRQIREKCYDELFGKVCVLKNFEDDLYQNYEIDVNDDCLIITNEKAHELNYLYDTHFSKNFLAYLFSIYLSDDFATVGNIKDAMIRKQFNASNRHNWRNIYLVKKDYSQLIDFEKLVEDISFRKRERIDETYKFSFKSYMARFFNVNDFTSIDVISPFCEKLVGEELNIYLDLDDYITFNRNTVKQVYEYSFEALEKLGKPSKVSEIHQKVIEIYPNYNTDENSIRASMKRERGFVPIGRRSIYGLKKWENEIDDFKGGTIRSITQEYLESSNTPKHIKQITEHILQYRPKSNESSISANLKLDESGVFKFFEKSHVGLSFKKYDSSFLLVNKRDSSTKKSWEESFQLLINFIDEHSRLPYSSGCSKDEKTLYRWYNIQNRKVQNKTLDPEKIDSIKSVMNRFSNSSRKRKTNSTERYVELNNFVKNQKRLPSANNNGEENLYQFFYKQRKLFDNNNLSDEDKTRFIEVARELKNIKHENTRN